MALGKEDSYYFALGFNEFLNHHHINFKVISSIFSDEEVLELVFKGQKLYLSFEGELNKALESITIKKIKYKGRDANLGLIECQNKAFLNDIAIFALKN